MSPKDFERIKNQMAGKPKSPDLSPEETKATIQAFRALPSDRRSLLAHLMKHPCANCEAEFKVPNVGSSHGICRRHMEQMYKMLGKEAPPPKPGYKGSVDLATLSPDELKLAVNLYSIIKKMKKAKGEIA